MPPPPLPTAPKNTTKSKGARITRTNSVNAPPLVIEAAAPLRVTRSKMKQEIDVVVVEPSTTKKSGKLSKEKSSENEMISNEIAPIVITKTSNTKKVPNDNSVEQQEVVNTTIESVYEDAIGGEVKLLNTKVFITRISLPPPLPTSEPPVCDPVVVVAVQQPPPPPPSDVINTNDATFCLPVAQQSLDMTYEVNANNKQNIDETFNVPATVQQQQQSDQPRQSHSSLISEDNDSSIEYDGQVDDDDEYSDDEVIEVSPQPPLAQIKSQLSGLKSGNQKELFK